MIQPERYYFYFILFCYLLFALALSFFLGGLWRSSYAQNTILLQTSLDNVDAITAPEVGSGGTTTLLADTPTATATPVPDETATATATVESINGVTDPSAIHTPAPLAVQPVGTPFTDPVFDTEVRRAANRSDSGGFTSQVYSQLQAFSNDNAYLLLTGSDGYIIVRVDNLSPLNGIDTSGWNVPRWYPAQPHTLVHFDTNEDTTIHVQLTNVDNRTTTTHFTFPAQYQRVRNNQSFDELSQDGRWMAGMVSRDDGAQVLFSLDLQQGQLGAVLPLPDLYAGPCQPDPTYGQLEPDWIGVSPLGNYLVVQWTRDGTARCSGLETFDITTGAFVGRAYDGHQHGDLGVDTDGSEFFLTFALAAPAPDNDRPAIAKHTLPGPATGVQPAEFLLVQEWGQAGGHISCQGPSGVCLVSNGNSLADGWAAMDGELFLIYTDSTATTPRVRRLLHHRSTQCGYWVQPRASLARDGGYAVFASDWGVATGTSGCAGGNANGLGDAYIVHLTSDGTSPTATPTMTATATRPVVDPQTPTPTATATLGNPNGTSTRVIYLPQVNSD